MQVTPQDIDEISGLVIELCGIYLDESKDYLIEARLGSIAQRCGCSTYVELAQRLRQTNDARLRNEVIDAITTHETFFFRDHSTFTELETVVVPELIDAIANTSFPKRIQIWSAACSTGQEPYSIAMALSELIPNIHDWDVSILATDVSDAAISKASRGHFSQHEVERGLTPAYRDKYFVFENNVWKVRDELRSLVSFQKLNLLEPLGHLGRFDIVFCRNVAIYFTPEARIDLFLRMCKNLNPGGRFFLGTAESSADLPAALNH